MIMFKTNHHQIKNLANRVFHKLDEIGNMASVALLSENKKISNKILLLMRTELGISAIPV